MTEKILYPTNPKRCIIIGPSNVGRCVFLANLISNFINEYDKIYIYSPSLHQDFYQKFFECFTNYIPIHIFPNIVSEEGVDIVIEEIVNNKHFEISDTEIDTYENIEELKNSQEDENDGIITLDDLNKKEMNDPRVQAMFERFRHNNFSLFIISQDYYELPKKTIRANGNIYHIFKPNNFRDVLIIYQDKSYMDMTVSIQTINIFLLE